MCTLQSVGWNELYFNLKTFNMPVLTQNVNQSPTEAAYIVTCNNRTQNVFVKLWQFIVFLTSSITCFFVKIGWRQLLALKFRCFFHNASIFSKRGCKKLSNLKLYSLNDQAIFVFLLTAWKLWQELKELKEGAAPTPPHPCRQMSGHTNVCQNARNSLLECKRFVRRLVRFCSWFN